MPLLKSNLQLNINLPSSITKRLVAEITYIPSKPGVLVNQDGQNSPREVEVIKVDINAAGITHTDLSQRVVIPNLVKPSNTEMYIKVKGYFFNKDGFKTDKIYTTYTLAARSKVKELLKKLEIERFHNKVKLNSCKYKDDDRDYNQESVLSNNSKWTVKYNYDGSEFTVYFINPLAISDDKWSIL